MAKLLGLALLHRTVYPKPFLHLWTPAPSGRFLLPAIDPTTLHNPLISVIYAENSLRYPLLCLPRPHHQHWSERPPPPTTPVGRGPSGQGLGETGSIELRKRLALSPASFEGGHPAFESLLRPLVAPGSGDIWSAVWLGKFAFIVVS